MLFPHVNWCRSSAFIVDFEHVSHLVLVFYSSLWTSKYQSNYFLMREPFLGRVLLDSCSDREFFFFFFFYNKDDHILQTNN